MSTEVWGGILNVIRDPALPPDRWYLIPDPETFTEWLRQAWRDEQARLIYGPAVDSWGMGV